MSVVRSALRAARSFHSQTVGAAVARLPVLEPLFIATGRRMAAMSQLLGTVYWFAEDDLVRRLRATGNRFRKLSLAGLDVHVDVTDGSARLHYFHGEPYEPGLVRALGDYLSPRDVFVDVGANIGYFTVLAARLVGDGGRVVAFEPHPGALRILRASLDINRVGHLADVVDAAAGAVDGGTTRLFVSGDPVLSTLDPARSPARDHFDFDGFIPVRQVTVDRWFAEHPALAARIGAVKIDVEGTEADVLAGMHQTRLASPRAVIICETAAGSAADAQLKREGYTVEALDVRGGAFGNYAYSKRR
jgi:FkbM family methyltransferase